MHVFHLYSFHEPLHTLSSLPFPLSRSTWSTFQQDKFCCRCPACRARARTVHLFHLCTHSVERIWSGATSKIKKFYSSKLYRSNIFTKTKWKLKIRSLFVASEVLRKNCVIVARCRSHICGEMAPFPPNDYSIGNTLPRSNECWIMKCVHNDNETDRESNSCFRSPVLPLATWRTTLEATQHTSDGTMHTDGRDPRPIHDAHTYNNFDRPHYFPASTFMLFQMIFK